MQTAKKIDYIILKELEELSNKNKKELLIYIKGIKAKKTGKTIAILNRTNGSWKNLIDAENLKKDIYSDRLISTRSKVVF